MHPVVGDRWFSLFPNQDEDESQAPQSAVEHSPLLPEEELEVAEHLRASNPRRRSGIASSPPSGSLAATAGVKRRTDKQLPPIVVEDPSDTVAMKRARNTLAARKSRQRKTQKMEEYEDKIEKLEAERDHWKTIALRRSGAS